MTHPTRPDEAPAAAPAGDGPLPAVSGQAFRDAIARVPSAVTIITTDGEGGRRGFTATAFASVSDDPPTVLVCLNRQSPQNEAFRTNARFAVNMLPPSAEAVANVFAGRGGVTGEARFEHGRWTTLATGAPVYAGAPMVLDCLLDSVEEVGTHAVLFGRVVAVSGVAKGAEGDEGVLIYRDRHYDRTRVP